MQPFDAAGDRLRAYLVRRGVSAEMRTRGLLGLVTSWAAVARDAAQYDLTLDDWRNDLDLRDIIAGAMDVAPEHDRVAAHEALARADALFRDGTVDAGRPLWRSADHPPDPADVATRWWYRRYPAHPGSVMREDLKAAHLLR